MRSFRCDGGAWRIVAMSGVEELKLEKARKDGDELENCSP